MDNSLVRKETLLNVDNKHLTRKHIAERQRRARINTYLEEIQKLTQQKNIALATVKPEKAEVLEKAVTFLENFKSSDISGQIGDTECYKQGFNTCISLLLDQIPAELQDNKDLKGLREHLTTFLYNLTTEAETMTSQFEYSNTAPGPYLQSPSSDWYQHQNGHDAVNAVNQSKQVLQTVSNGSDYSAANNQKNFYSQNLLCRVQETPKWFSDWNTQMQMQYIESYEDQNLGQDVSSYDAFQGIKSVYSNYLQDEDSYSGSEDSCQQNVANSQIKTEAKFTNTQRNKPHSWPAPVKDSVYNGVHAHCSSPGSKNMESNPNSVNSQKRFNRINTSAGSLERVEANSPSQLWRPW